MNHTRLWVSASIIALVVILGFALSVPHTRDVAKTAKTLSMAPTTSPVALRDVFKKGTHTITGSLMAPDACSTASSQASLQGDASSTQSILVEIFLPEISGVCLQLPTKTSFQTILTAPANLPLFVTVNGITATTSTL